MKLTEDKIVKIAHNRNLPVKVIRIIKQKDIFKIPSDVVLCGAYILITRSDKNKIYIGSTKDFSRRMMAHKTNRIKGYIPDTVYLYETENIECAKQLEKWLIKMLWPELNTCRYNKTI